MNNAENTKMIIKTMTISHPNPFPLKKSSIFPLNKPTINIINRRLTMKAAKNGVVTFTYSIALAEMIKMIAMQKLTKMWMNLCSPKTFVLANKA